MRGDARFPRSARLLTGRQFEQVFKQASRSGDACFSVLARRNAGEPARLGLAISRKAAATAVARNRVKRLVRESFRHRRAVLAGLDIVVMARPGITARGNGELVASLERHWKRIVSQCSVS